MTIRDYILANFKSPKNIKIIGFNKEANKFITLMEDEFKVEYTLNPILEHIRYCNQTLYDEIKRLYPEELI